MAIPILDRQRIRRAAVLAALAVAASLGGWAGPPRAMAATTPFTDIAGTTFEADIEWLYAEGITTGCTTSLYCPTRLVTRGEMASFLARMFDLPATDVDFFSDDDGTTHEVDINRLAAADITAGCAAQRFCPNDEMRRDEMASFLVRAIPLTVGAGRDYFYDDNDNDHEGDIDRAAAAGITTGCATWRYCPDGSVTRGQMAAYLHRVVMPLTPPPYPAPAARTLLVAPTGSDQANDCLDALTPCVTIGHAVALSQDGDTVRLAAGTYHEGHLFVQTSVTLVGAGRDTTIVDGAGVSGPVFYLYVANTVKIGLRSMTVTGGNQGGIRSIGSATIEDVRVAANQADTFGGGIFNAGTMSIRRSLVIDNDATGSGGGIWSSTRLTIDEFHHLREYRPGRGRRYRGG